MNDLQKRRKSTKIGLASTNSLMGTTSGRGTMRNLANHTYGNAGGSSLFVLLKFVQTMIQLTDTVFHGGWFDRIEEGSAPCAVLVGSTETSLYFRPDGLPPRCHLLPHLIPECIC